MSLKPYISRQFSPNVSHIIQTLLEPDDDLSYDDIAIYGLIYKIKKYEPSYIYGACLTNNIRLVNLILSNTIELGLFGACEGGHINLVKYLVGKYYDDDVSSALYYACKGGNSECINYILSLSSSYGNGLRGAVIGGHLEVVKYIYKYCNITAYERHRLLTLAAQNGHIEIVKFFSPKSSYEWSYVLQGARCCGNDEIIKLAMRNNL